MLYRGADPARRPVRRQRAELASAILKRSLTLSLTNPKAILFYVSFFVQFIDVNAKTPAWRSLSWR